MTQKEIICPICSKKTSWDIKKNPYRPFCSERCKLIDLGDWAAEKHRVPGESASKIPDQHDEEGDY